MRVCWTAKQTGRLHLPGPVSLSQGRRRLRSPTPDDAAPKQLQEHNDKYMTVMNY